MRSRVQHQFCQITVRKAVTALTDGLSVDLHIDAIAALRGSVVSPLDVRDSVLLRDQDVTHMYLALLHRINGDYENAFDILRPYIEFSLDVVGRTRWNGQTYLSDICIVLGQNQDAVALAVPFFEDPGWGRDCKGCGEKAEWPGEAVVCRMCLDFFCGKCFPGLKKGEMTNYCLSGHDLLKVERESVASDACTVPFRGEEMDITDICKILAKDWTLKDVLKDAVEEIKDAIEEVEDMVEAVKNMDEEVKDMAEQVKDMEAEVQVMEEKLKDMDEGLKGMEEILKNKEEEMKDTEEEL